MYSHEREALKCITQILRERLSDRIVHVFAFGSRVRGDYDEWSDFDVLVVVREKTPEIESEIISIIVDEETRMGLSFSPVIKDIKAFEREKSLGTPFYENIVKEGIKL